jgi:hypothetical protein
MQAEQKKEKEIEDRKDKRIQMQGSQQSEMIDQRQNNLLPVDFQQPQQPLLPGLIDEQAQQQNI